ncbi:hypothetical protein GQ457_01G011830 [Hibiscus cannabinus]
MALESRFAVVHLQMVLVPRYVASFIELDPIASIPKLQIIPEKGLTKCQADTLLSLLNDHANANAREGRAMIFNLVEAAQEFLSEIVPVGQSQESVCYPHL